MSIKQRLQDNWFFIGIAVVVTVSFLLPAIGAWVRHYNVLDVGIFLAFLITGLTLKTSSILAQFKNLNIVGVALVSAHFLIPMLAYPLAHLCFSNSPDFTVGTLIVAVAPVTVASGTVMTAIARGNVPLSLLICVISNLFSIVTIPLMLKLMLHFGDTTIQLPVYQMLTGLTLKVFLPICIGQVGRPRLKAVLHRYRPAFSIFNQSLVLLIILNAVSSSTGRILQAGTALLGVLLFMVGLHVIVLAGNNAIAGLMRLDLASRAAFTIHVSQKTLTISYLVWAGYFAHEFPMALIPPIVYHLTQMIMDTFVARRFRDRAAACPPMVS